MKTNTNDPTSKWLTITLLVIMFAVITFCLMRFGDKQPNAGDTMGAKIDSGYTPDTDTIPGVGKQEHSAIEEK